MGEAATKLSGNAIDVDLVAAQFDTLDCDTHRKALFEAIRARDAYRKLIDQLQEKIAKLEQGLIGPTSQRYKGNDDPQLSQQILAELLGKRDLEGANAEQLGDELLAKAEAEAETEDQAPAGAGGDGTGNGNGDGKDDVDDKPHGPRGKPTGRPAASEHLQKVTLELIPNEVKRLGLDAFERIGEETSTTVERRVSSLVEVTVVRPKYRAKTDESVQAVKEERAEQGSLPEQEPKNWITVAPVPELPLPRVMAGPALLANVATRRFDDALPYNRLENVYEREGMRLGRSTMYGWLDALCALFAPLIAAMRLDARSAPYVCIDATGVLVQAPEKCARGHFWVLVVPGRHVIFAFSMSHNSEAVDELLGDYEGYVVADAHAVYDHLYGEGGATEVGCWGHARSYFFKTLESEPDIAKEFLGNLRVMFMLERKFAVKTRTQRERMRKSEVKVIVDRHFELCRKYEDSALDGTPLRAAIRYSLNQEGALRRFLEDGRLPATNNISERGLRKQAVGRKNWLFIGSKDGAAVNTTFTTLIASCHLHDIEPEAYLREVMCLLPDWPERRVLELAPCNWKQTRQQPETQRLLADNFWLSTMLEIDRLLPLAT